MSTYKEKCMVPKYGHIGTFPANFCIKIVGKNGKSTHAYPLLNMIRQVFTLLLEFGC